MKLGIRRAIRNVRWPLWSMALLSVLQAQNPYASPADVELGRKLYLGRCGHCHGQSGEGGRGATLNTGHFRHGGSERELYLVIRNGIPNTEMPGTFSLPEAEVWRMVAYVKQLSGGATAARESGDAAAGAVVYANNGCAQCHTIQGKGGAVAPDLTGIGARRAVGHLRESIVRPDTDIPLDYRSVAVSTLEGKTFSGIHLNEDEYSIQMRDMNGNLLAFRKSDLKEVKLPRASMMPPYTSLSEADLSNLVSYLDSLRKMP